MGLQTWIRQVNIPLLSNHEWVNKCATNSLRTKSFEQDIPIPQNEHRRSRVTSDVHFAHPFDALAYEPHLCVYGYKKQKKNALNASDGVAQRRWLFTSPCKKSVMFST